jgi:hypothetical protein
MKTTRYGIDPDPITVEVRMAALVADGLTPESFGVTDFQLRYHLDQSRSRELRELIKIDPFGRGRLSKFLPENHPASIGNGHSGTAFEGMPQTRGAPVEPKTPRQEIDPTQIDEAIQRGLAVDNGGRAETNSQSGARDTRQWFRAGGLKARPAPQVVTRRASEVSPEPISWLWKYWLARGKLHIIAGVPETGKTTMSYAAIVSSGGEMARRNARNRWERLDMDGRRRRG